MSGLRIDWGAHVTAYKRSGKSLAEYCQGSGVKITTLRHHVYKSAPKARRQKPKSHFQEFPVVTELIITRMPTGELSLRGFDTTDLATIVRAWSHALQG